ncbi:hypothetical protein B0H11DRAFT_2204406 [Mycena galericulata]|nr:hypothetical protein B0H11DRAFT_2204406 [Mycena galericulata]
MEKTVPGKVQKKWSRDRNADDGCAEPRLFGSHVDRKQAPLFPEPRSSQLILHLDVSPTSCRTSTTQRKSDSLDPSVAFPATAMQGTFFPPPILVCSRHRHIRFNVLAILTSATLPPLVDCARRARHIVSMNADRNAVLHPSHHAPTSHAWVPRHSRLLVCLDLLGAPPDLQQGFRITGAEGRTHAGRFRFRLCPPQFLAHLNSSVRRMCAEQPIPMAPCTRPIRLGSLGASARTVRPPGISTTAYIIGPFLQAKEQAASSTSLRELLIPHIRIMTLAQPSHASQDRTLHRTPGSTRSASAHDIPTYATSVQRPRSIRCWAMHEELPQINFFDVSTVRGRDTLQYEMKYLELAPPLINLRILATRRLGRVKSRRNIIIHLTYLLSKIPTEFPPPQKFDFFDTLWNIRQGILDWHSDHKFAARVREDRPGSPRIPGSYPAAVSRFLSLSSPNSDQKRADMPNTFQMGCFHVYVEDRAS